MGPVCAMKKTQKKIALRIFDAHFDLLSGRSWTSAKSMRWHRP